MNATDRKHIIDITINGVTFAMIYVVGGYFTMGASPDDTDAGSEETPAHYERLNDFYIGETLVTQALWKAVMGSNPSKFTFDDNNPVESISWDDCHTFIERLVSLTGINFALPSEAQWEYAARGGRESRGYKYAGSNNISQVCLYVANSHRTTHPVKQLAPNELGLYDMCGNVNEWCEDRPIYYSKKFCEKPKYLRQESYRAVRGGSWLNLARHCRISSRGDSLHDERCDCIGMRLCINT
ncbi:MAG: formylglycine-generating enzyme family protein [Coprobacter sp.]|nr:formylglycine-generating enzyme family protein [Coprobacter sp.]